MIPFLLPLLLITCYGGSQLPYLEDTQADLWKRLHGENWGLLPIASYDQKLSTVSCGNESSWKQVPSQSQSNLHITVAGILSDSILIEALRGSLFYPCHLLRHRNGEDPAHLGSPLVWLARKISRFSQEYSGWPKRPFWFLQRLMSLQDTLLIWSSPRALSSWNPTLPGPERKWNSVLSDLGIFSQSAEPAPHWLQCSLSLKKELWLD